MRGGLAGRDRRAVGAPALGSQQVLLQQAPHRSKLARLVFEPLQIPEAHLANFRPHVSRYL